MYYETQLTRLKAINWSALGTHTDPGHCQLANEFLYNAAKVASHCNVDLQSPYFEPASLFSGTIDVPMQIREEFRSQLPNHYFVFQVVCRHLQICLLADNGIDLAIDNVCLYDPLIRVLEAGGVLDLHRGDLVIDDSWTSPRQIWLQRMRRAAKGDRGT